MFFHHFKYTLKYLFRNRLLIFWTYAFPIILGALFYLAFSDIEKNEKMDLIDIAIVEEVSDEQGSGLPEGAVSTEQENGSLEEVSADQGSGPPEGAIPTNRELLLETMEKLSDEDSEDRLFRTVYVSEKEAEKLLEKGKISGYLLAGGETPKVVVKESGINETIFRQAVGETMQNAKLVAALTEAEIERQKKEAAEVPVDVETVSEKILREIQEEQASIRDTTGSNLSYTMIEYYTLIAMACLYCATIGMYAVNCILANMSKKGMRISVSPVKKGRLVLGSLCASYVVQLLGLALLFIFTIFVLKVDYGPHMPRVILLALAGSFAGLSMGIAAGALIQANETAKTGMIIAVTMLGCFLSGMMGITMKYVIDKNMPVLNKVNPAAMITDGLYALYYYNTFHRYWFNVGSLLVFSAVMIGISFFALRRQRYQSL